MRAIKLLFLTGVVLFVFAVNMHAGWASPGQSPGPQVQLVQYGAEACGPGTVWVPGKYDLFGEWVPGFCRAERWVPGHFNRFGGWVPGHWG